jgi:hypothetical protein
MPLRSSAKLLDKSAAGSIVLISFSGDYPPGSEGNGMAQKMKEVVTAAVKKYRPTAVVFDLSELHYRWGDAISGVFWALLQDDQEMLPSCVIAADPTRKGLMRLITASRAPILFNTKFTADLDEALAHLASRLRRSDS